MYMISLPSIRSLNDYSKMFTLLMYPEGDDDEPFSSKDDIDDFIENFQANLEKIYTRSFMNFHFLDKDHPIAFKILWKNGTLTTSHKVELSENIYRHISYFELETNFFSVSDLMPILGCTQWNIDVKVYQATGSYLFKKDPSMKRERCSSKIVIDKYIDRSRNMKTRIRATKSGTSILYNKNHSKKDKALIQEIQKRIAEGTLDSYVPEPVVKDVPVFVRSDLPNYQAMVRFALMLTMSSMIQIYIICSNIYLHFKWHKSRAHHAPYNEMDLFDQFHTSIGFWDPFFLVTQIILLICSVLVLCERTQLTQYLSQSSIVAFGIGSFLLIVSSLRCLKSFFGFYKVVLIVRYGVMRLINLCLAQSPLFISMMLVSIFLFGFVTQATQSFTSLFEMILALTFGDNIYEVYKAYTDGSTGYNINSFVFVTIMTAITMWLFFPTFTASIMYIHKHFVRKLEFADN